MLLHPPRSSAPIRSTLVALLAVALAIAQLVGVRPGTPAAAASTSLSLAPGLSSWVKIGSRRTSPVASVAVTVPSAAPIDVGLQLRAGPRASGYRAVLSIGVGGAVSGSFRRVTGGVETTLGAVTALGLTATAGDVVRLEAAVVGSKPVRLYLRAWENGLTKPPNWQLTASDSSGGRYSKAGYAYLWALPAAGTQVASLAYGSVSVASTSAKKAAAIGVLAPEPAGDTFSIAVMPDTQGETSSPTNTPFLNRVNWLVANRARLDLRYVLHTGDMTNWGWLDHAQVSNARAAVGVLAAAGIPYALTIGNHDTRAVGWDGVRGSRAYGGAAYMYNPECPSRLGAAQCKSWLLVRHTETFNTAFPLSSMGGVGGAYEAGKVDNYWTSFRANDTSWLVLTLELWPREGVVAWAKDVVASHPDSNVIIQTHNYLSRKGKIVTNNGGYGATSPKYLYDQVVSKYANVKLVFSGHTGGFTHRTDKPKGNTVVSYLGNELGNGTDPVRVVSINTATGRVFSAVYDPLHLRTLNRTSDRISIIR